MAVPTLLVRNLYYDVPVGPKASWDAFYHHRLLKQDRTWDSKPGYKQILSDINFTIYPGEFMAIIGPSGSGKTSLLSIITKRVLSRTYKGRIELLGSPLGAWIKPYLGYVMQEDTLYSVDTPRETLMFTANMKLQGSQLLKRALVENILEEVGLSHVADNLIGTAAGQGFDASGTKQGMSGGERRRVSIGNEIVSCPKLLCLDEPTSGLDISTATDIVNLMRKIADSRYRKEAGLMQRSTEDRSQNVSVIATLHQPSSQMWAQFDKVLVMAKGRIAFYGRPDDFLDIANRIGYAVPPNYNPADYLIEMVSKGMGNFRHAYDDRVELLSSMSKILDVDRRAKEEYMEGGVARRRPVRVVENAGGQAVGMSRAAEAEMQGTEYAEARRRANHTAVAQGAEGGSGGRMELLQWNSELDTPGSGASFDIVAEKARILLQNTSSRSLEADNLQAAAQSSVRSSPGITRTVETKETIRDAETTGEDADRDGEGSVHTTAKAVRLLEDARRVEGSDEADMGDVRTVSPLDQPAHLDANRPLFGQSTRSHSHTRHTIVDTFLETADSRDTIQPPQSSTKAKTRTPAESVVPFPLPADVSKSDTMLTLKCHSDLELLEELQAKEEAEMGLLAASEAERHIGTGPRRRLVFKTHNQRMREYMERRRNPGGFAQQARYYIPNVIFESFDYRTKYAQPYTYQFYLLLKRCITHSLRKPERLIIFFFQFTIMAWFAGSLWWRLSSSQENIANKIGALFYCETVCAFAPTADAALNFFRMRQGYLREHASGTYATAPFLVTLILVDLPVYALLVLYFSCITYFTIGFNLVNIGRWFYYMFLLYFTLISSISLGYLFVSLFGTYVLAQMCVMVILSIIIVFAGPYINSKSIPSYWKWMPWFSFYAYSFRGLFYNEVIGRTFTCAPLPPSECPIQTGEDAIRAYGLGGFSLTGAILTALGYMTGWIGICFLLTYLNLRYRRFK